MSQSVDRERQTVLEAIVGRRVEAASSSLSCFAVKFDDGTGVLMEACQEERSAAVRARSVPAEELPSLEEAVCSVDWSWILGSVVTGAGAAGNGIRLRLDQAGPLTVGSAFWEGKPFLSFQPYKPARQ